jgi:hypothetical protein
VLSTGASCPMCRRTASRTTASIFAAGTRATDPALLSLDQGKKAAAAAAAAVVKPKPAPAPPTETAEQLRDRVRAALLRRRAEPIAVGVVWDGSIPQIATLAAVTKPGTAATLKRILVGRSELVASEASRLDRNVALPPELVRVAANDRLRALGCLNGATRRVQLAKGESE